MNGLAAISKNQPRGRPFPKGMSGNPTGRPRRTDEETQLIEACRAKTPEALAVIVGLMQESTNDRVRLAAAQFLIERGYGRAPERVEIRAMRDDGPLAGAELTPRDAYLRIVHGELVEDLVDDAGWGRVAEDATGLEAILAEQEG